MLPRMAVFANFAGFYSMVHASSNTKCFRLWPMSPIWLGPYSSRIIFSYTFNLEPNTNWIGWTVSEIWPFKIIQDSWRPRSWIWPNRKWRHSICRPRKPCRRIKHEADWMIRCRDMAVRKFPKCAVGRSVGRSLVLSTLMLRCTPLRYFRNVAREE